MTYNKLTPEEEKVIIHKGTERPFSGEYIRNMKEGVYVCKRCDSPLYLSEDKFDSRCGWPSFDDEISGAITKVPDSDGLHTEILCNNCEAHLGHVFLNEGFTPKNVRHCVNSISMKFIPTSDDRFAKAYFASGCFWGTEYHFQKVKGVIKTTVGYMGGTKENPTYKEVCTGTTGHVETLEVLYDTLQVSYEDLVELFFETHDFTQLDGQGPDIGEQYLSVLFYTSESQKEIAQKYIDILNDKDYFVTTSLESAGKFWIAEDYHQQYYEKNQGTPYCHIYRKIFD